jgi:hypothetical protein
VKERASSRLRGHRTFCKRKHRGNKIKDCYNTNKDQVVVEMEEWSGKEKMMKQKGKLREKKETEKIFIDKDLTKQEREDTEETKNHRERRKKGRELSKSGI